jgi:hypothetical protein
MGFLAATMLFLQDPIELRIAEMLRENLEARELSERLARLGPEASGPIAQQLVAEAARGGTSTAAMSDALLRLDSRSARDFLRDALRDPATPPAARAGVADALVRMRALDEDSIDDESLDADVRLTVAESLWRRGDLNALTNVLAALGRIRRDDASLAARADALAAHLRFREEPLSRVVELPDPPPPPVDAPARERQKEAERDDGTRQSNLLIGFGAIALAALLLATRRRA